jgi:hypothetical protein
MGYRESCRIAQDRIGTNVELTKLTGEIVQSRLVWTSKQTFTCCKRIPEPATTVNVTEPAVQQFIGAQYRKKQKMRVLSSHRHTPPVKESSNETPFRANSVR